MRYIYNNKKIAKYYNIAYNIVRRKLLYSSITNIKLYYNIIIYIIRCIVFLAVYSYNYSESYNLVQAIGQYYQTPCFDKNL